MLHIKLLVSGKRRDEITQELESKGIVIDDDADLLLTEKDMFVDHLILRNIKDEDGTTDSERHRIDVRDIITIESFGHDIIVITEKGEFKASERLYQFETLLDPKRFMRISNSVIAAKDKIQSIKPTLSMKFILTMTNGRIVDVTRSYYNDFRDRLGI